MRYMLLICADEAVRLSPEESAAIEVASRHPVARIGTVEVRPFWPA